MDKLAYNLDEAAAASGVSVDIIRRAVRAKNIPVRFPTSRPIILRADLEAWLEATPTERPVAS